MSASLAGTAWTTRMTARAKRRHGQRTGKCNAIFVHYSSDPKTKKDYRRHEEDEKSYSFHKQDGFDLRKALEKIINKK